MMNMIINTKKASLFSLFLFICSSALQAYPHQLRRMVRASDDRCVILISDHHVRKDSGKKNIFSTTEQKLIDTLSNCRQPCNVLWEFSSEVRKQLYELSGKDAVYHFIELAGFLLNQLKKKSPNLSFNFIEADTYRAAILFQSCYPDRLLGSAR